MDLGVGERGGEGEGELSMYSSTLSPRAHKKATAGMGPDLSNTLTPKAKAGAAGLEGRTGHPSPLADTPALGVCLRPLLFLQPRS